MKKSTYSETDDLIRKFFADPNQAEQMISDIKTGDKLLSQVCEPSMPEKVAKRIEMAMAHELQNKQVSRRLAWIKPLISAAAVIIVVLCISIMRSDTTTEAMITDSDDYVLIELSYAQESQEYEIDHDALKEALLFWEDDTVPVLDDKQLDAHA